MFCQNCGTNMIDGAAVCPKCGYRRNVQSVPVQHEVPRCQSCGYTGKWKVESILRPIDWVLGILLLFAFGSGLIYFLVVFLIRCNKNRRDKICPECKARNLWTFIY